MWRAGLMAVTLTLAGGCAQTIGLEDRTGCPLGTEFCDGLCLETHSDPENCGGCGVRCNGASCVEGRCVDTDCSSEFAECAYPGLKTNECEGLDCVEWAGMTRPVCLRRCLTNDDCPGNMFCAPSGENAYASGFKQFQLGGGHCLFSFCGGPPGEWYYNGIPNGECWVGGEAYLQPGAADAERGTCLMVNASTSLGQCMHNGTVPQGGTCTFQPSGCVPRASVDDCQAGDICIGQGGNPTGTCAQLCTPGEVNPCPAGLSCLDVSGGAGVAGACQ